MKMPLPRALCKAAFASALVLGLTQRAARAEWQQTDTTIGWSVGTNLLWRFSFDPAQGKTFFHPLTAGNGVPLTFLKPKDHSWHYGLWFSWKYINHVNYWEENPATDRAEGSTRWATPEITTHADGSAAIRLAVTYTNPSNRVEMTERRELKISAPQADGSYTIDWRARFRAGKDGAILDRTPMPNEPNGKVNGGYAGLGLRMPPAPLAMSVVSSAGPVTHFASDRARPNASAVACNFADGANDVGGIAIFSDPKNAKNAGDNAPWYIVKNDNMRFVCAAILAPGIRTLKPGEKMNLRYRITVRPQPWTPESLQSAR